MANLKSLRKILKLNVDGFMEGKEDKEESLVSIIDDMNAQVNRIEVSLNNTKTQQAKAEKELKLAKEKIKKLNNDANSALEQDNKTLANAIEKVKNAEKINLLHKEELYNNLSIQSIQLKEQLEVLNEKLLEVSAIKSKNIKEQEKPFTDAIIDRLMKEIRDSQKK